MADLLLFGRLADARRARPRPFKLFNAHLDEILRRDRRQVKIPFGRDPINYFADLLFDDLARNTACRYALPCLWALTIGPKFRGTFQKISMGKWYSLFQCGRR